LLAAALALWAAAGATLADAAPTVRLGILKFGTVAWEIDVIKHHGLDTANGIALDVLGLANKNATTIALNAGEVDMIVTDWIWVSRQRDAGFDYTFVPYSEAAGSLMVHRDRGIEDLMDLDGKVMGVAGGAVDKSWLLLRAYSIKQFGRDIGELVHPAYGAPPLLHEKFLQGEFDGVLNFWNYSARLRARETRELIKVQEILPALGVPGRLPLIGYVFAEAWAADNPDALEGFLAASAAAREIMLRSDDEWQRLMPLTGAKDEATLVAFRDGFRDGVPKNPGPAHEQAIRAAFAIIAELGGRDLVGKSTELAPGTVWKGTP
jgi:NitT/TauT family transport system substrate-binding protein